MKTARVPRNESARLQALAQYAVLDTPREPSFDAITTLVASVLDAPIAMVSIVDATRLWCKSCHGTRLIETPRDVSFCAHVVADGTPLIVPDALNDERFFDNPLVTGEPRVRFYAGVPLATDGFVLGTLSVVDHEPRELSGKLQSALSLLAGQTVALLELRRQTRLLAAQSNALANRELELSTILDTAVDAIITIDRDGLIEGVNPAVGRLFGYAPSELIGRNVSVLMPSPDRERHDSYLAAYERTGQRKVIGIGREVSARRKDGSMFPADLAVSQLHLGGAQRFTGIIRDLSERKRIERLKSEFVSTVSHELRTPLTSVRGALGLIAAGVTGELPTQAKAYIDIALSNAERLGRLINDILDLEKIQSGALDFRQEVVGLGRLLEQAIAGNDSFAAAYRVRLSLSGEVPDVDVVVDEDQLTRVLTNLISNAVKFSPAEQTVELSVELRGDRARVNVRDHGSGIPEEFRARIFQRFAQADGSDRRRKGGTGLGLSIAKSLVEGMRGDIGFDSPEGKGTRFFIDLPWLPSIAEDEVDGGRMMLVCEDDLDVGQISRARLTLAGGRVHHAPTLERARQLLTRFRYCLVTLDLLFADGNGCALVGEIREKPEMRDVPIVVVSAPGVVAARARLGVASLLVAGILPKPLDEARLLEMARNACRLSGRDPSRVFLVQLDAAVRQRAEELLAGVCQLVSTGSRSEAVATLSARRFDVVLLDVALLDGGGQEILELLGSAQVLFLSAGEPTAELARRVSRGLLDAPGAEALFGEVLSRLSAGVGTEFGLGGHNQ